MDKLTRIKKLLNVVGLPKAQQADLCAYVILALSNIKQRTPFAKATNQWMRIHDIIVFTNANYDRDARYCLGNRSLDSRNARPHDTPQW